MATGTASDELMMVRDENSLSGGESSERETGGALGCFALQPHWQLEFTSEVEKHIEELRPLLQRIEVAGEMGYVEPPESGPLDLGSTLAPGFVEVGMVPEVGDCAGEAAIAVEQTGRLGEGPPTKAVEFGVEGEMHTYVVARSGFVDNAIDSVAGPDTRHHEGGGGGTPIPKSGDAAGGGGMGGAEQIGTEDEYLLVGVVAQGFGEGVHDEDGSPGVAGPGLFERHVGPAAHTPEAHVVAGCSAFGGGEEVGVVVVGRVDEDSRVPLLE